MIMFLTFGEAQIIGDIVHNLIAFGLFLGAIGYFASMGKWLKCSAGKAGIDRYRSYGWDWCKIPKIYWFSLTTVSRWFMT